MYGAAREASVDEKAVDPFVNGRPARIIDSTKPFVTNMATMPVPIESVRGPRRMIAVGQPVYLRHDGHIAVWRRSVSCRLGTIEAVHPHCVIVSLKGCEARGPIKVVYESSSSMQRGALWMPDARTSSS